MSWKSEHLQFCHSLVRKDVEKCRFFSPGLCPSLSVQLKGWKCLWGRGE